MLQCLLDLLFPRRSLLGDEGEWITAAECRLLRGEPIIRSQRQVRDQGVRSLDGLVGATSYASPLARRAIHALKYKKITSIVPTLADLMADALTYVPIEEGTVICPVPLHWRRKFMRGFNQAELLGLALSKKSKLPYQNLLKRTRSTGAQVGRHRDERLQALTGAFAVTGAVPEHILLIDDVCTTGTTLDECAMVLKKAGAKNVMAAVLAVD